MENFHVFFFNFSTTFGKNYESIFLETTWLIANSNGIILGTDRQGGGRAIRAGAGGGRRRAVLL